MYLFHRLSDKTFRRVRSASTSMVTDDELLQAPTGKGAVVHNATKVMHTSMRPSTPLRATGSSAQHSSAHQLVLNTPQQKGPAQPIMGSKIPMVVSQRGHMPKTPAAKKVHADGWSNQGKESTLPTAKSNTTTRSVDVPEAQSAVSPGEPLIMPANNAPNKASNMASNTTKEPTVIDLISEDDPPMVELGPDRATWVDPRKDGDSSAWEKSHSVSNRGYEAEIYTLLAIHPMAQTTEVDLIIVPKLDREDPVYNSVHCSDGVVQRTGMVFPINIDGHGLVMITYTSLEEFNQLRGLASRQFVLQPDMVTIQGEFEYGHGVMRHGIVDYKKSPFSTSVGRIEGMQILPLVLHMTRPEDAVQCCINLTLLTFSDLSMHIISASVSTVPTGTDLLRYPHTTRTVRLMIPALQNYQTWHAQCMQWANVAPEHASLRPIGPRSPSPSNVPPMRRMPGGQENTGAGGQVQGVVPRSNIGPQANVGCPTAIIMGTYSSPTGAQGQALTPASPEHESNADAPQQESIEDKAHEVSAGCRDPRVGSSRGVYSPLVDFTM